MSFLVPAATVCFILGALILFLGVAVLREGARERLHRVTALMLFFGGLGAVLAGLGLAVRASAGSGTTLFTDASLHFASAWEFFFPSLLLFTLVFPTEHPWLKRFGFLQELIFVPYVFHLVLTLVADRSGGDFFIPDLVQHASWAGALLSPLRVFLSLLYGAHAVLFSLVNLCYVVLTLTVLAVRGRHARNPRLRAQTSVMVWGLGTCLVFYSLAVPLPTVLGMTARAWDTFSVPFLVLSLVAGGGSIAYSIIRHRFLDARLLLRRTLVFLAAAGVVAILYLELVTRIESFISSFSGLNVRFIEPVFLMIALVVLQPIVTRLDELVDRWILRDRREGRVTVEQLSRDIVTLMDLPTLGQRLTGSVADSMVVEGVGLLGRRVGDGPVELLAHAGFSHIPLETWSWLAGELDALEGVERPITVRAVGAGSHDGKAAGLVAAAGEFPLALLVPLRHGGELLGALVLGPKATRTRYTAEDLALLATLGNQTAAALRNTHLLSESLERAALEEELHLARQIQVSYLPSASPRLRGVELSGTNLPSKQVGGDYYDWLDFDRSLFFVVADVVGKGVPAALLMSMLQASLRTMASEGRSLTDIIRRINRLILESRLEGKFATCFLARLDAETLMLEYSNAGHNPPLLLRGSGTSDWLSHGGLLLGAFEDPRASETRIQLRAGDRLVLYTDGITEALDPAGEFYGEDRLKSLIERLGDRDAESSVQAVMESVKAFAAGSDPTDDMTVVVLRVPAPAGVALLV